MERDDIIPIPIRADFTVRVHIPLDLTLEEAQRVARVIVAFAAPGEHQERTEP